MKKFVVFLLVFFSFFVSITPKVAEAKNIYRSFFINQFQSGNQQFDDNKALYDPAFAYAAYVAALFPDNEQYLRKVMLSYYMYDLGMNNQFEANRRVDAIFAYGKDVKSSINNQFTYPPIGIYIEYYPPTMPYLFKENLQKIGDNAVVIGGFGGSDSINIVFYTPFKGKSYDSIFFPMSSSDAENLYNTYTNIRQQNSRKSADGSIVYSQSIYCELKIFPKTFLEKDQYGNYYWTCDKFIGEFIVLELGRKRNKVVESKKLRSLGTYTIQ